MATIQERRAKAARKRIDKGRKPFTDTKPAPKKKRRTSSKGLPKRGKIAVRLNPGSTMFQATDSGELRRIMNEIRGPVASKPRKKKADDGPVTSL